MTLTPNKCIDSCCDGCGCNVTKEDIGLGNVDNTSDVNKPISTAVQTALSQKASASTVATIGSNLTALDGRVSAIEGTFVTLGTAQSVSGAKTFNGTTNVPNTTLGDTSAKAVNGSRLMAEINNLSGLVTVATTQAITGDKNFTGDTQFSGDVQMDSVVVINGTATFANSPSVPNTTVGDTTTKAVNGKRVVDELNNYAPMVRTTGNQTISGIKTFSPGNRMASRQGNYGTAIEVIGTGDEYNVSQSGEYCYGSISFADKNGVTLGILRLRHYGNTKDIQILLKDNSGSFHSTVIATWSD